MSKFQAKYKRNTNYEERRSVRAVVKENQRRETRHKNYATNRNIDEDLLEASKDGVTQKTTDKRTLQFMLWKLEKEKRREAELEKKAKDKPPFKCGVVHYKPAPSHFPSPLSIRRSNRNKAFYNVKVETTSFAPKKQKFMAETTSFAPKKHQFLAPKNVVAIEIKPQGIKQMLPSSKEKTPIAKTRIEKSSKMLPEHDLSSDPCAVLTKDIQSKGSLKTTLEKGPQSMSLSCSIAGKSGVQPRRSARISNTQVQNKKKQNVENTNSTFCPSISEHLSSVREERNEEEDKDVTATISFIYPVNLSPWISVNRGSGSGKKARRSVVRTPDAVRASGGLRKQIGVKIIEKILSNPEEIEKEERKFLSSTGDLAGFAVIEDDDVKHYRDLYSEEMRRLGGICFEWDAFLSSQEIPVDIQDSIRTTIGQTRLLMREKLGQFKGLVDDCATCSAGLKADGQQMVTPTDLQGFWDLVSIQVNDVDTKFGKLKALKDNNWIEVPIVQDEPEKKLRVRNAIKKPVIPKKLNTEKKSAFQLYILEQKKKNQKREEIENQPIVLSNTPLNLNTSVRSILRSEKGRRSSKILLNRSIPVNQDPGNGEERRRSKNPVTPHYNSLKGRKRQPDLSDSLLLNESPKSCTPMPQGDLISWESPYQDILAVRRSPRVTRKIIN